MLHYSSDEEEEEEEEEVKERRDEPQWSCRVQCAVPAAYLQASGSNWGLQLIFAPRPQSSLIQPWPWWCLGRGAEGASGSELLLNSSWTSSGFETHFYSWLVSVCYQRVRNRTDGRWLSDILSIMKGEKNVYTRSQPRLMLSYCVFAALLWDRMNI